MAAYANSPIFLSEPIRKCNLSATQCFCDVGYYLNPGTTDCFKIGYYKVDPASVGICLVIIVLITLKFFLLLRYVKDFTETLLERQNLVSHIARQNQNLRKELLM